MDTSAPAPSLDLAAASDSGNSDSDNITNKTTLAFTGLAEQASTVTVFRGTNTVTTTNAADGTFSFTDSVSADGVYTYGATETDRAGNMSPRTDSLAVTVDTVAPALNVTAATSGSRYTLPAVPVRPTFAPTDSGSGVADKHDEWTTPNTSNGAGQYSYTATATDRAGNSNTETRTYTVSAAPTPVVRPVIGKPVTNPRKLVAGKQATISFKITRSDDGKKLSGGTINVDSTVRRKRIAHHEQFKNGTATLRLNIPKTAKGKQLKVHLTIKYKGQTASRTDTFRIR